MIRKGSRAEIHGPFLLEKVNRQVRIWSGHCQDFDAACSCVTRKRGDTCVDRTPSELCKNGR